MKRLLAGLGLLVVLAVPSPAGAHGDEGELEVIDAFPTPAGNEVTYTVELTYANDGDLVDGATVTARLSQPGAGPQPPVELIAAGAGRYASTIPFPGPGRWTITFAATEPRAQVRTTYEVPAEPTTTTGPPATVAPSTTAPGEATLADGDSTDDAPTALFVGLGVTGALVLVIGGFLLVRRFTG